MDFVALAQQCAPQVAHQTMAAIVQVESGFRPLAINVNGGSQLERQPKNRAEAVTTAQWLIYNGYSIDLGVGQVNSKNLARKGLTVEAAFDPCANLGAAASILEDFYVSARRQYPDEQSALRAAVSAYNTGSFSRGFGNGYVQKVVGNAVAASGADKPANVIPLTAVRDTRTARPAPQRQADAPVRLVADAIGDPEAPGSSVFGPPPVRTVMVYE